MSNRSLSATDEPQLATPLSWREFSGHRASGSAPAEPLVLISDLHDLEVRWLQTRISAALQRQGVALAWPERAGMMGKNDLDPSSQASASDWSVIRCSNGLFGLALAADSVSAAQLEDLRARIGVALTHFRRKRENGSPTPALQTEPETDLFGLTAWELQRVMDWGHGAEPPASRARSVITAIWEHVQRTPSAPAVMVGDGPDGRANPVDHSSTQSYAALWQRSERMALCLRRWGVRAGDRIATCLSRGLDLPAVLLGIWRAGAAYVPLDPRHPAERLRAMLAVTEARWVLHDEAALAALAQPLPASLNLIDIAEGFADAPPPSTGTTDATEAHPERHGPHADDLAYVMFTSGSTGVPKAIGVPHRGIARLVVATGFADLGPGCRMLQAAPLGFDAATLEIWGPLANGGLCVLHGEDRPTPARLKQTIAACKVNTAWLTAGLFNAIVDTEPNALAGLQHLLVGGEALSVQHLRRAQAAQPGLRLTNGYGPTETTTFAATFDIPRPIPDDWSEVPIGRPIHHTRLSVRAPDGFTLVPPGYVGELWIGGDGVALGYLGQPALTAERFVDDPHTPGLRWYRTGDRVAWQVDEHSTGCLRFMGRLDGQVKLRGFRIELGEIDAALQRLEGVRAAATVVVPGLAGASAQLVAWVVRDATGTPDDAAERAHQTQPHLTPEPPDPHWLAQLRHLLSLQLPRYMLPHHWQVVDALPTNANGKLDRAQLLTWTREAMQRLPAVTAQIHGSSESPNPLNDVVACLGGVLGGVLGQAALAADDHFFDKGGDSLSVLRAVAAVRAAGLGDLPEVAFYSRPTPRALAAHLTSVPGPSNEGVEPPPRPTPSDDAIAIIAVAGRFPGATDVDALWAMLREGREGITHFSDADLDPSITADERQDADYVKARGVIDGVEMFDAGFFGFTPREAELTDPQQRVFLEVAHECLEQAGYAPGSPAAATQVTGVFAGMYNATYWQRHLVPQPERIEALGAFQVMLANEKDYLPSRVAHRLDLKGPAVNVQSACSTSLVAVAQAVAALRAGDCRMALAGGVAVTCPPRSGYRYEPGSMLSPDGRTRSFDAAAAGTVFSDGAAVVLLKRYADALADGDTVHALIRSVAVNNDGRHKASFTAPSVDGQAEVLQAAWRAARIRPDELDVIEAHGTATPLGDPIEVQAIRQAWLAAAPDTWRPRGETDHSPGCRLGSLKSNVGHMVTAAGAAGVIKTVLALRQSWQPQSLHVQQAHPRLGLADGPLALLSEGRPWRTGPRVRLAGVSSFGVGGTNAHAVLEEAPQQPTAPDGDDGQETQAWQTLVLSARSESALKALATRMADALEKPSVLTPTLPRLGDVAHTLRTGRAPQPHRLAVVARHAREAAAALRDEAHAQRLHGQPQAPLATVWMFPGQGAQRPGMGLGLVNDLPRFAQALSEVCELLDAERRLIHPQAEPLQTLLAHPDPLTLAATEVTQPAVFAVQWALAQSWLAAGLHPVALVGHSVGEFAAAVVAGVMSVQDAARLVVRRGALMQACRPGAMLQVRLSATQLQPQLREGVSVAAENAPGACVVAGNTLAIESLEASLSSQGVTHQRLATSHAFHTTDMAPAAQALASIVAGMALSAPRVPIASTCTGRWLQAEEATSASYWAQQLREPVQFAKALQTILAVHDAVMVEVGPGRALCGFASQTAAASHATRRLRTVASLPEPGHADRVDRAADAEALGWRKAQAQLWAWGWNEGAASRSVTPVRSPKQRRVPLPTSVFERQRHWVDAPAHALPPVAPTERAALPAPEPVTAFAMPATMTPPAALSPPIQRRDRLIAELRELCADVAGMELPADQAQAGFIDLGLDSLTLTQLALQVKRRYQVPVSFRQLMESTRSLEALAIHLDGALPAEAPSLATRTPLVPATVRTPTAAEAALQIPVATLQPPPPVSGAIQQLIQQQLALMAQQLALLGGVAGSTAPATGAAAAAEPGVLSAAPPTVVTPPTPSAAADTASSDTPAIVRYDVKTAFGAIARIHTQAGAITQRQQARLDAFIRRYTERTARSKAYTTQHRGHLADPRVVNGFRPLTKEISYQIVIEQSHGSKVRDIDGHEYVDVLNGFGMNLFGWSPAFVQEALHRQIDAGYEIGPQHPLAGEVAQLVCELTGHDRAGLCNTGSEAVMAAVRMARTVTGRQTLAVFAGSYHGTFDEVVVRAGRQQKGIPGAPGILAGAFGDVRVLEYGTSESMAWLRAHANDLAAVLVEPVQSRRPNFQPVDFLRELRALTEASGSCLIFDEVITGFRAHLGGVQAAFGIRADLATYGKVIGGGLPIGVVAGRREYMDALDGGGWQFGDDSIPSVGVTYFAGTFVRHPLALAAAHATLQHLKTQGPSLQEVLNARTTAFVQRLNQQAQQRGAPIEIRHFGSLWRVSWLQDNPLQDLLFAMMRSRGVHILDNFPCFLTTAHTDDDLQLIEQAFADSIAELQAAEFLPGASTLGNPERTAEPAAVPEAVEAKATLAADTPSPPVAGARAGRDKDGRLSWFVPDPARPGRFRRLDEDACPAATTATAPSP